MTTEAARSPFRVALAALLLVAALGLLAHTFAPRYAAGMWATAPRAMILPRAVLLVWAALAGAVLLAEWRGGAAAAAGELRPVLRLGGLLLVAAVALPWLGFALVVTPLVPAVLLVLGERRPVVLLLATALLGPGLWALFHHVLLIRLPSVLPGGLL